MQAAFDRSLRNGQSAGDFGTTEFFEIEDFGFELDDEPVGRDDADEVPEIEENPVIKLGDLIELGHNYQHRLLCGDSTNDSDVDKLLGGTKIDLIFTDPPYNVAFNGRTRQLIKGDKRFVNN